MPMAAPSFTVLNTRAVLSVSGEDAVSFLQGLVSNDVTRVSETQAIWAAFLTPQGKFLHEFMIVKRNGRLLLDCEADRREDLLTRLKRFRLRSKVELAADDDLSVAAAWGDPDSSAFDLPLIPGAAAPFGTGIAYRDPRLLEAGVRLIAGTEALVSQLADAGFSAADQAAYDAHRIALGLPGGSRDLEVEKALLLENGFEELDGVDFKKGCYIGQELTARTHYRALIKKRLLPVAIEGVAPPPGTPLTSEGKDAGEMKTSAGGYGLALIRLATWRSSPDGLLTDGSAKLRPQPPAWISLPPEAET